MSNVAMLLVPALFGIDFGWEPIADANGGIQYIIRLNAGQLESLREGTDIVSDLPVNVETVRSFRITTFSGELRNEGRTPPQKPIPTGPASTTAPGTTSTPAATAPPVTPGVLPQNPPSTFPTSPAGPQLGTPTDATARPNGFTNNSLTPPGSPAPTTNTVLPTNTAPPTMPTSPTNTLVPNNTFPNNSIPSNTAPASTFPTNTTPATTTNTTGVPPGTTWNPSVMPPLPTMPTAPSNNLPGSNPAGNIAPPTSPAPLETRAPSVYTNGPNYAAPERPIPPTYTTPTPRIEPTDRWAQDTPQATITNRPTQPNSWTNSGSNESALIPSPTAVKERPQSAFVAAIVALGLSLGANCYLGMLSVSLYNRCRVLLSQLRYATIRNDR